MGKYGQWIVLIKFWSAEAGTQGRVVLVRFDIESYRNWAAVDFRILVHDQKC